MNKKLLKEINHFRKLTNLPLLVEEGGRGGTTVFKEIIDLVFKNEDEVYDFLYKEHTMEIFGHASSVEYSGMNDLNDFYTEMRENHDIIVVSDEIGKSKPATLFFLAKFGCLVEQVRFYSESTINSLWDSVDILLTANPNLLLNHPENKKLIKYETFYNKDIKNEYSISTLKELKTKIEELND
jgi:hypothetical protein